MQFFKIKIFIVFLILLVSVTNVKQTEAAELHVVDVNGLKTSLNSLEDDKKILFFFTSWCPYCKDTITDILRHNSENYKKFFFISLDQDYSKIANMTKNIKADIKIYYMSSSEEILHLFKEFKLKYNNSIPYIAVLDEDNNLIKDNVNTRQLYRYLR
jgi:thiol-disulfide isomerase/thioredoxin